jgi:hypothetical protein
VKIALKTANETTLGCKPKDFESVDLKSTVSVWSFPRKAGIQVLFHRQPSLDARVRGHDGTSVRLKGRGFDHPRRGH